MATLSTFRNSDDLITAYLRTHRTNSNKGLHNIRSLGDHPGTWNLPDEKFPEFLSKLGEKIFEKKISFCFSEVQRHDGYGYLYLDCDFKVGKSPEDKKEESDDSDEDDSDDEEE